MTEYAEIHYDREDKCFYQQKLNNETREMERGSAQWSSVAAALAAAEAANWEFVCVYHEINRTWVEGVEAGGLSSPGFAIPDLDPVFVLRRTM